jgi:S-adenosylmethionine uptake transporter
MYRGLIGTILLYSLVKINGGTLRTHLPWQHAWRGIVGVAALWMWFYSVGVLPLAMSMTLNYTAPIWIAAFLFILALKQKKTSFEWGLAAAILASFIGILLLLRPTIDDGQLASGVIALVSGILSALAYLQVRRLGHMGEPEYRVVFYFSQTGDFAGHRAVAGIRCECRDGPMACAYYSRCRTASCNRSIGRHRANGHDACLPPG